MRRNVSIVLALVVVAGLGALAWRTLDRAGIGSPASPSVTPIVSDGPEPDAVADPAWWRTEVDPTGQGTIVRVGTVGAGETVTLELRTRPIPAGAGHVARPERRVVGPRDGIVVLVEEDGAQSVLTAVDAASGERRELLRTGDLIVDADYVADGLVFLAADELDGTPLGAWVIDPRDDDPRPEPIDGLVAAVGPLRPVAIIDWITELVVDGAGSTVAVHRCVQLDCELRTLDLASGEQWAVPLEFGSRPVAITGGLAILVPVCVDVDCRIELLDLGTGARRPAPGSPGRAPVEIAVVGEPRPTLVTSLPTAGPADRAAVELLDLETMTFAPLDVSDLGSIRLVGGFGWDAGVELPPGAVLVNGSRLAAGAGVPRMAYFIVDLETGDAVEVPELGQVFVQG